MPARDSIEELIKRSKIAAQKLELEATGKHRKEPNQKRQFEIQNPATGEIKWSRLSHLEFGSNPWGMPTVDDQLDRVKQYANELGLEATGVQERKTNARYFEVRHPDGRTKLTTLRGLQDQKNPFGKQTLDEQISDAKVGAKARGLKITGKFQLQGKGNRKIFEVVNRASNRLDDFWAHLSIFRSSSGVCIWAVLAMFSSVMLMFIRTPPNSVLK